jgi:hypothetical protein
VLVLLFKKFNVSYNDYINKNIFKWKKKIWMRRKERGDTRVDRLLELNDSLFCASLAKEALFLVS